MSAFFDAAALSALPPDERRAMEFLGGSLPASDLAGYPPALFLRFVRHALALRSRAPWCGALDWEVFAHYVLFPRVNDEDLSFHREVFCSALWPQIQALPTDEERVLEVNRWCHEHASYQAQDGRTASPMTVYRCGSGRCGEESAFLVSALRSVGIAARQVYAPRWSHCDDNHAWVEALCGGRWRFLGACEPEPALDRGWFTTAASRAVLVHSRLFGAGTSPLHGEPLGREGAVRWFSQTARYADVWPYTFRALAGGRPAAGAKFYLQVLNEASFHTVAVLTADGRGEARAALGQGSLHVLAVLDGLRAEGECGEDGVTLTLAPPPPGDTEWTDFPFHAPAPRPAPAPLGPEDKDRRAAVLRRGSALRAARMAGYSRPGREGWEDLRRKARGNWGEVSAFLGGPDGERRERLVRTLTDKDLRDVAAGTLEDHFAHLPPRRADVPEEVYWAYAACPRIGLERLTPWRGALAGWLEGRTDTPSRLWRELGELLPEPGADYAPLWLPPCAALKAGACDEKSRALLLTALLRTQGIPARLRPLDGAPEYWENGGFRPVEPEQSAVLRLTCPAGGAPRQGVDWSLSRQTAEGWQTLAPEGVWRDGALRLAVPAGRYRVVTAVRLPGGGQLAARREVALPPGAERTVPLRLRTLAASDLLTAQALPAVPARTADGASIPDLFRMGRGPVLALWLEAGDEPSEHLLGELAERRDGLAAFGVELLLLPRGREGAAQAPGRLDGAQALTIDWAYDLEAVARCLGRDPDSPPLAVLCDGAGTALYSDSGYRVGSAELLLRAAGAALPRRKGPPAGPPAIL